MTEFFGGIAVLLGVGVWIAASAISMEMIIGTIIKKFKWHKEFGDYSYDILILGLCVALLAFGSGAYSLIG